ncbi:MAG: bifunctional alpha/beta hydrolase/class I SAM-dependent methyltransferase [Acidobacteriota bacterium]
MKQAAMSAKLRSADLTESQHRVTLRDGLDLFYRVWRPAGAVRRHLIVLHRGHEHSGRLEDVVQGLALEDTAVYAWDARGHGRSGGDRGWAESFMELVRDLEEWVGHLQAEHDLELERTVLCGHSVGAIVAATWAQAFAPPLAGQILVTPAFRIRLYVPFARAGLKLLRRLRGDRRTYVKSYVKAGLLTHDKAQARQYESDPLITRDIAVNVLLDLRHAAGRLIADAPAMRTPTLVLAGGSDWVVDLATEKRFFERLGASHKSLRVFPGMYHDILHEVDRDLVLDEMRRFLTGLDHQSTSPTPLDADQSGPSRDEQLELERPLPWYSPRRWFFAGQRLALATFGRASAGIRLGWETGFDSGRSLDYVYENQPRGLGLFGRWADRIYLDSPGWRGIRQRRQHLEGLLERALDERHCASRPVHLVDIATGAGRYVLSTLARRRSGTVTACLRDNTEGNLRQGRATALRLGLEGISFELGDAFDEEALARLQPAPDVAIVSGLYELFPDNLPVLTSLQGLARAMPAGALLIYTGQPWHPQLETIARVLRNRDGARWVMRRRSQEELDALVRAAGFDKVAMEIGDDGIFTVSLARRRADRAGGAQ